MNTKRFATKRDGLIMGLLVSAVLLCAYVFYDVQSKLSAEQTHIAWAVFAIIAINLVLLIWCLVQTFYEIVGDELKIVCGPYRKKIDINTISRMERIHSAIKAPALSFDRIKIDYEGNKSIMISPDDKQGFIKTIEKLNTAKS